MARRAIIPQRQRIFFGCEGKSEFAFGAWLQEELDRSSLHLHLDRYDLGGGDSLALVIHAIKRRKIGYQRGAYISSLALVDEDRFLSDGNRAVQAHAEARKAGIVLVLQRPTHEGLILRMMPGYQDHAPVDARAALEALNRAWAGRYQKPAIAADFRQQGYTLDNLAAAARTDEGCQALMQVLGLR